MKANCRLSRRRCGRSKKGIEIFQRTSAKLALRRFPLFISDDRKQEAIENINEVMEELKAEIY